MAFGPKWWTEDTVAVVTGSNKGIGYEIVKAFSEQGLTVVLTARDQKRGEAAVDSLKALGLKRIFFHQLDVTNPESVKYLATWLKKEFGGIDILVNNAGIIAGSGPGTTGLELNYSNAKEIVDTNYFAVQSVTEILLPLLRPSPHGARIITVSTRMAFYERLKSDSLLKTFRDEESYSKELGDKLANKYLADVKAGKSAEEGWIIPGGARLAIYSESKLFLNVYLVALAKSLAKSQPEGHEILVSEFCPGTTETAMLNKGKESGFIAPEGFVLKTPKDGADTGVWLALLPKEDLAPKVGKFYGEREEYPFGLKNPPFE